MQTFTAVLLFISSMVTTLNVLVRPGGFLLIRGINQRLQHVVHFLSRSPTFLNHLVENVLNLSVSFVPFPEKTNVKQLFVTNFPSSVALNISA